MTSTLAAERRRSFRISPTAQEVIDGWLARNHQAVPPPSGRWDVGRMELFNEDRWQDVFRAMRAEAPVNKVTGSIVGDYWNVCTHKAIQHVESLPELFSSSWLHGGISIAEAPKAAAHNVSLPMFIAMDRPEHTPRRRTIANAFTPAEMLRLTQEIRDRTGQVLDGLPQGEQFDWVSRVSVELTTAMLAILFDFPREDSPLLSFWSDWITAIEAGHIPDVSEGRVKASQEMTDYFMRLWDERKSAATPGNDLLSMMIHSDSLGELSQQEFMGTLMLLVTGGNDTTRNTMSGFIEALDRFPEERARLEADPTLVASAVPEVIRFVTPAIHMRRTATQDTELFGQQIAKGDKIVLWYLSANFDESQFDQPDRLIVDRENARRHLAFGYGIHRCVGARLAELQLRVLMEEMLARRIRVHITGEVTRGGGAFMHALRKLEVTTERY